MPQVAVRAEAIEPVQFQFQRKRLAQQQPAQRCRPHLLHVLELHVLPHARDDFLDLPFGKAQPLQNLFRHRRADFFVLVKMDFARRGIALRRHGLADVVQNHRPRQGLARARRQFFQHQPDVLEHGAFGMIIRRLLARNRRRQFRQNVLQQSAVAQQHQTARRGRNGRGSIALLRVR